MKFTREDIEKVYKTSVMEESLLVFQAEGDHSGYIEYAVVKVPATKIDVREIHDWIDQIPRFRDVYIHENDAPLRIRFKKNFYPVYTEELDSIRCTEDVYNCLIRRNIRFDVQHPPLFRVDLFYSGPDTYVGLTYHHILFDGVSVQMALSKLDPSSSIEFTEWTPAISSQLKTELIFPEPFKLEEFLPPSNPKEAGFFKTEFQSALDYEKLMLKWIDFLKNATGKKEIVVGEVFSARNSEPSAALSLGYFVQTWPLVVKTDVSEEEFRIVRNELIQKANEPVKHYYAPNTFDHCWVVEPSLKSDLDTAFYSTPHYSLTITFNPNIGGTKVGMLWNLDKTNEQASKQISNSFQKFLELDPLSNETSEPFSFSETSILQLWQRNVEKNPDAIAVEDVNGVLSYEQLDKLSTALAKKLDILPQERVGIHTSYSSAIIISFLAVLKRGGIYVPLDPTVSSERISYILEDAGIRIILSDLNPSFDQNIISPHVQIDSGGSSFEWHEGSLKETCYLIYTSGTTGQPKGCAVNHGNLLNLFLGTQNRFNFNTQDKWILAHSYGFDFSTWEIWGALLNGAQLYIPDREQVKDTFSFHAILKDKAITILNQTPKSFYNFILVDSEYDVHSLRYVVFGGDKLQIDRINEWMSRYANVKLINMYGITETTVHVTFKEIEPEYHSNIGRPLPGYGIYLSSTSGEKVPDGFLGEIMVTGKGVCNGYFGKPELTAEKFTEQGTIYHSGDLAWKVGDEFYYFGRRDRQVKIRGYRIELGEIEFLLKKRFAACDFTALVLDDSKLIAFQKGRRISFDPSELRGYMPDYMIPSWCMYLEEFPLNQNGKIDEKQLIELYRTGNENFNNQSVNSSYFIDLLSETLGRSIDADKSFIQNGGDSISAIRIINKLKKEGYSITVQSLFQPLPLKLTQLEKLQEIEHRDYIKEFQKTIVSGDADQKVYFPLSEAQQGILMDCLRKEDRSLYMEILNYEIPKSFSVEQIKEAYASVCRANPILMSRLKRIGESYVFAMEDEVSEVMEIATSDLDEFDRTFSADGMDLYGSLSNLFIVTTESNYRVSWVHHHLILDGWSLGVFSKLMMDALNGIDIPYSDRFTRFLCQSHLEGNDTQFWQKVKNLKQQEKLIPLLPDRNSLTDYTKKNVLIPFENKELVKDWNISEHSLALGLWSAFLSLLFRKNEFVLGNVVSLRSTEDYESLGMYVRTLPFYFQFDPEITAQKHLRNIFSVLQEDHAHKNEPLNAYVNADLFDHLFVFENYPVDEDLLASNGIRILDFQERTGASWTTIVYPKQKGFEFSVLARTDSYAVHFVDSVLTHFADWVQALNWEQPLSKSIECLRKSYSDGEAGKIELSKRILEILSPSSDNIALVSNDRNWSYQELWSEVNKLSEQLNSFGIQKNEAIGVDVHSTVHFTLSVLAIWKSGGITCSVDRRYPLNRKEFIYENAGVRFVFQGDEDLVLKKQNDHTPKILNEGASFILHTSGSTGQPKGVIQTHSCLINLIDWNRKSFGLNSNERILQLSSFGFDASYHEILLGLSLGATLIEVPLESRLDIHEIKRFILTQKVTLAWIPARLLNAVLDSDPFFFDECTSLKKIVTTGEALVLGADLKAWILRKEIVLLNFYGPTETHVVTSFAVNGGNMSTQPCIGRVLPNCEVILMHENQPAIQGLPGEIWVAGANNAHGYLNDVAQTEEKFVTFMGKSWYKTGDWAYRDENGDFHFIGRKDDQVKIRGFRVEPLEIERIITEIDGVNQCCILIIEERVTCFYVSSRTETELYDACSDVLPDYMVPSSWIKLDAMPLNQNGKADRDKLKSLSANFSEPKHTDANYPNATRCWKAILGHADFGSDSRFEWVGGNSIMLMKMQAWLERNYKVFVSVSELSRHATISLLEALLDKKFQESAQELPSELSLNPLQRNLLIAEIGSEIEVKSPFQLEFSIRLKKDLSNAEFENAVKILFDQFPQLSYVVDGANDPEFAKLRREHLNHVFFAPFEQEFRFDQPLIRFILRESVNVTLQWHHILLDGLSMGIILRCLADILEGNFQKRTMPIFAFTEEKFVKQSDLRVRSIYEQASFKTRKINASELVQMEQIVLEDRISLTNLIYETLAITHNTAHIAVAHVEDHPGVPGMFTDLRGAIFTQGKFSGYTNSCEDEISVVVNYMELPIHSDWVNEVQSLNPVCTKYPYEWQFVRMNDELEVTFYFSNSDQNAEHLFELWERNLNSILSGDAPLKLSSGEDIFDDFNF